VYKVVKKCLKIRVILGNIFDMVELDKNTVYDIMVTDWHMVHMGVNHQFMSSLSACAARKGIFHAVSEVRHDRHRPVHRQAAQAQARRLVGSHLPTTLPLSSN